MRDITEGTITTVECGIVCFLCARHAFDVQASSSHPLGYPCAKFCFCRALHWWDSPWRKISYSINHSLNHSFSHSLTHPAYLMHWKPNLSLGKYYYYSQGQILPKSHHFWGNRTHILSKLHQFLISSLSFVVKHTDRYRHTETDRTKNNTMLHHLQAHSVINC